MTLSSHAVLAHDNGLFNFDFNAFDAAGPNAECHQCNIRNHHTGFTGAGFADFERKGAWIEFMVDVPETKTTNLLLVRYSAGNSDRPVDVTIDGQPIGSLMFLKTKNWDTWMNEMIPFESKNGSFKVRLEANESSGPNVDMILLFESALPTTQVVTSNPLPQVPNPTVSPQSPLPLAPPKNSPSTMPNLIPSPPGPTIKPVAPTYHPTEIPLYAVILEPGKSLQPGSYKYSPSGMYKFGMAENGDLRLYGPNNALIWQAFTEGAVRAYMQQDGNFLTRLANKKSNWKTATSRNPGAKLILDDGGQAAIWHKNTKIWLAGIPSGEYAEPPNSSLEYPLRGAFYYAWYPETWTVNGKRVFFRPTLGNDYSNNDPVVQQAHVDALDYIHVDVAIASWWGIDQKLDRARITNLLDKSVGTNVKWSVYHEMERHENNSPEIIREDLSYLKKWFAWHPSWAHIDGRPVIFVYNEGSCGVPKRWNEASNSEWYVVLKTFPGYKHCEFQPDHWHEYGPAYDVVHVKGQSFAVSPGFWRADMPNPRLSRVSKSVFRENVREMVESNEDWQLITTFNEWGEGTAVESAYDWGGSQKNNGIYMEALHDIHHRDDNVEHRSFWT